MGLFKEVKKPVIKATAAAGAQISPLRPRYVPKTPPCIGNCPSGADIRGWITTIAQAEAYGRSEAEASEIAWRKIVECNPFPSVCGRICPHPCEDDCRRKEKDGAVAVNALERFVGDFALERGLKLSRLTEERRPEPVAVIGSGPAGLSCAYQLARRGYSVTVYEAFRATGGMLRYGIPRYRLPLDVLEAEIRRILDLGVELRCGTLIGKDISLEELRARYPAIFAGIGAHRGLRLQIPGEEAQNVFTGTEFLNRINSGNAIRVGDRAVVVGGGDTAVDAARVCLRLGAGVTLLYRRTRAEMPAIRAEVDAALEEGILIQELAAPIEISCADGRAVGMKCVRMALGAADGSGRPRPLPIAGSDFHVDATAVIAAIGQEPESDRLGDLGAAGSWIKTVGAGSTDVAGIYSGGDAVRLGLASIAIGQGRSAAEAIDARLRGVRQAEPEQANPVVPGRVKLGWYKEAGRHERSRLPVARRGMDEEIESGLSPAEALEEARRCLSCGMCMDCETCWMYCTPSAFVKLPKGEHYRIKLELCNGCKKCAEECPCGYIEMV